MMLVLLVLGGGAGSGGCSGALVVVLVVVVAPHPLGSVLVVEVVPGAGSSELLGSSCYG